ncbi:MAG: L-threonylcarbamoyladenylate synthase [Rhizonema sp. PD37]|nr:L-threonylcarbamoyladenylate synthase [Rhizonema sp. PD37]
MVQVSLGSLVAGAKAGKLVSFPTDTVPALAVLPEQGELIFAAKQRSYEKPLILLAARASQLWSFVTGNEDEYKIWLRITDTYWPGALTLVLPASAQVSKALFGILPVTEPRTVGIRVPDCAIAQSILEQTGPLATSSANLSAQPPLQTMSEIEAQFPNVLTLSTESIEEIQQNISPSTVAKWTGKNWQILRQGAVKLE